jgi:zinc-ribbon domain
LIVSRTWSLTDRSQLHDSVRQMLEYNLAPGEPVLVIIRGAYDQAIVGTDRRALQFRNGAIEGAVPGEVLSFWDYDQVLDVTIKTGWLTGSIVVQAPGVFSSDGSDGSPNTLPIGNKHYPQARAGVALLRKLIEQVRALALANQDLARQGQFCGQCGAELSETARFCGACGAQSRPL